VEQIGTPLELFDRPRNLFVAQFIGSPAMNVMAGTLRMEGERSWVEAQGQSWPTVPQLQGRDGQAVQYGVRPTDIRVSTSGAGIPARVVVVEPTGAETELLLRVGEMELVVVMHGRTGAQPDDTVFLEVDAASTHVFDGVGGQRLDGAPATLQ
jgi:multiple sugar transport system ATP-binding protein